MVDPLIQTETDTFCAKTFFEEILSQAAMPYGIAHKTPELWAKMLFQAMGMESPGNKRPVRIEFDPARKNDIHIILDSSANFPGHLCNELNLIYGPIAHIETGLSGGEEETTVIVDMGAMVARDSQLIVQEFTEFLSDFARHNRHQLEMMQQAVDARDWTTNRIIHFLNHLDRRLSEVEIYVSAEIPLNERLERALECVGKECEAATTPEEGKKFLAVRKMLKEAQNLKTTDPAAAARNIMLARRKLHDDTWLDTDPGIDLPPTFYLSAMLESIYVGFKGFERSRVNSIRKMRAAVDGLGEVLEAGSQQHENVKAACMQIVDALEGYQVSEQEKELFKKTRTRLLQYCAEVLRPVDERSAQCYEPSIKIR